MVHHLRSGDALIIVDLQNDFLAGGSLAVPDGDQVVPVLNSYLQLFTTNKLPVFATRDWHPPNHMSFKEFGGPWPPHCVADTPGSQFASNLNLPPDIIIISTATTPELEAYSGFSGTILDRELQERHINRLFVGGLATDYCVLFTVKDGLHLGYQIMLLTDAIRAVNVKPNDGERAIQEMVDKGAVPTTLAEML